MKLEDLIKENSENHYRLLVLFDDKRNPQAQEKVIEPLKAMGWQVVDVEEKVLELITIISSDKLKLRFMRKLKELIGQHFHDRVILINTEILYSPELDSPDPVGAFKYHTRKREMVLIVHDTLQNHYLHHAEYGDPDFKEIDLQELAYAKVEDIDA